MIRKIVSIWGVLLFALLCSSAAFAQGRLDGKIMDQNGKPYAGVTVTLENTANGQRFTAKTNKNGEFTQLGMTGGIYKVTLTNEADHLNFTEPFQVKDGQDNHMEINLKDIMAQQAAAHPEEQKKREEEEKAQKDMKLHFDNGVKAMQAGSALATQIRTAPKDQKSALEQQRTADCQTAVTEFQQAEKGVDPKQVNNQVTISGNLGEALECAGHYDDAAAAYQKASTLKPDANLYNGLATNLAKSAAAQTDPKVADAKLADANAACEKASALDPTNKAAAATCWKNVGIVLENKGDPKAAPALQKATEADPKDAQTWFLLGNALTAQIDGKQEGGKIVYTFPPGLREAYQKCIDLAPNAPIATQAKQALAELSQMSGGTKTTVIEKH
ncbi:MAG TPA: carboxypeptidase regulatory-like domain-containing protein [Candidatus Acidoferrales bacterium]|nr:carboxypeptidase regulatory-like domain-containing protein [Candidatus Acidoferrales bacterium]